MNTLDHGPKCICVPCSLKSGRFIPIERAAELLGCNERRVMTLASEGKIDRVISVPTLFFADSVVAWAARRKQRKPRTPADQTFRWRLADSTLRKNYGMEPEDWARLFEAQGGKCPGCRTDLGFWTTTHVDHCHQTGRVRGLLCRGCNVALGSAGDHPETLRNLAVYLETF